MRDAVINVVSENGTSIDLVSSCIKITKSVNEKVYLPSSDSKINVAISPIT